MLDGIQIALPSGMKTIPISQASSQLRQLFEDVIESRVPVRLTGRNASAVLVSWDDWNAIEQTMHRLSMPALPPAAREHRT